MGLIVQVVQTDKVNDSIYDWNATFCNVTNIGTCSIYHFIRLAGIRTHPKSQNSV